MHKRDRAAAIIIHDNKLLLMYRSNHGKEYWVFPGGGVEKNETAEQAVLREIDEETTLTVTIEKLLYHHQYLNDSDHYFYLCRYITGEAKLGNGNEQAEMRQSDKNIYKPLWVAIEKLAELLIYPLEIRDWLIADVKNNFADTPRLATFRTKDLRQTL